MKVPAFDAPFAKHLRQAEFFEKYSKMRRSTLCRIAEWMPMQEQIEARPELTQECEQPMFLLIAVRRQCS
jgi:hypothetical protein